MSGSPLVSVVTPFYNTGRWLRECIESVLRQSFTDFEYILVDNSSTDGGGEIAAEYARRDPRIKLVRTDRLLPQVENYNFSLRQISSNTRYCKIAQADDWLYPDCLRSAVEAAERHPDIDLVCWFVHWNGSVIPSGIQIDQTEMSGRDACRLYFLNDTYLFGAPSAQFWRASAVRGKHDFFDADLAPLEDASICFELLDQRRFAFVHQILSFSRREEGSLLDRLVGSGWPQAHKLQTLRLYGKKYLSEQEYAAVHARWLHDYRYVLASLKLRKSNPEFKALHERMMKAGKMEDASENLFWPLIGACIERVGNPKRFAKGLARLIGAAPPATVARRR